MNAARTATEQIIDLRGTLRYMGVPLRDTSYMFRDNKTVVDSGSLPHATLHKRHTMLSYHHICEAIASGMVKFFHISGEINPADILCWRKCASVVGIHHQHICQRNSVRI